MTWLRQLRAYWQQDSPPALRLTFAIHLLYALYKGAAAVWYRSAWFAATACYYLALSAARFFLLRRSGCHDETEAHAFRTYRTCGVFLLALTCAIAAVNFYTIRDSRSLVYPWHLIYGVVAYTFFSLTLAIIRLVRSRRQRDPLFSAARYFSLSAALVALFSAQMALLGTFGSGESWELPMNIVTGSVVFLVVMVLALHMIRRGTRMLRAQQART